LWFVGRFEDAIREHERALELDPLSLPINATTGGTFYWARKYAEAIEQLQKTLDLDANFFAAHFFLGAAYVQKSMYQEAIAEFEKALVISSDNILALSGLGSAHALAGRKAEAQRVLDQLTGLSRQRYVPAWSRAIIYVGLGEKDKAFEWLERSSEERSTGAGWSIKVAPALDPLRDDPRFADLLRRMNLQP
jgi:tetratricopeptide (TPR) repeat protein